jgi:predicted transposase/invertase (TIGR01784 family)
MSRYLNPKNDLAFKTVFGGHKTLCISLLNALLRLEGDRKIRQIEYLDNEMLPRIDSGRNSIVDVRCTDKPGRHFIVEMQMYWTTGFEKRVLFNASKAYVAQLGKTEKYEELQPVYMLSFINDIYDRTPETGGEYYHHYALMHEGHPGRRIECIELIFVELPKFKPQRRAEKKFEQLWLLFLTAIDHTTQEPPKELLATKETKKALNYLERAAFTDEQLRTYDGYWDAIRLERSRTVGMYDEGLAKGKAEGLAEGEANASLAHARKMMAKGFSQEDIAEITGIPIAQLRRL